MEFTRRWWREVVGAAAVLAIRLLTMPKTFWELDELLFGAAVVDFDPWSSRPHPPGYPLFVGLGKLFNLFFNDPFRSLVAVSVLAAPVMFVALALAFRRCLEDANAAAAAAFLFAVTPAMLVFGPLPLSDSCAMAFAALALYAATLFPNEATERAAIGFGLAASAAIGARPQLLVPLAPVFLYVLLNARNRRNATAALLSFTILSLVWFVPLVDAAGGWDKLWLWESRQAKYVASHDAALSRGAASMVKVAVRFLSHPLGPKAIALPLLLLAGLGIVRLAKRPKKELMPLALFGVVSLLFAIFVMDPADAVRYSIPHMAIIALLIGAGLMVVRDSLRFTATPVALALLAAFAFTAYSWPILHDRATRLSPPAAAAQYAEKHFPQADTVILYQPSLRPHAEYLMRGFRCASLENGLREYAGRKNLHLVAFVDGGSHDPDAKVFAWSRSDAYGKLTRNLYQQVALDVLRDDEEYVPVSGVYPLERTIDGQEWRWLGPEAMIRLPALGRRTAELSFSLSPDAPYESNTIHVLLNGREIAKQQIWRAATSRVEVPIPGNAPVEVMIRAEKTFEPARALGNQDPRTLSVQLVRVEQSELQGRT